MFYSAFFFPSARATEKMLLIRLVERKWLLNSPSSFEGNNKTWCYYPRRGRSGAGIGYREQLCHGGWSRRSLGGDSAGRGSRNPPGASPRLGSHRPLFYYKKLIFTLSPAKRQTPVRESGGKAPAQRPPLHAHRRGTAVSGLPQTRCSPPAAPRDDFRAPALTPTDGRTDAYTA